MSEKWCHPGCMDGESATQIQQHLASCSIEELQDGLSDLVLGDDDSDETMALIDAYLAELDARSPCTTNISAEESLRNFHEKYDYLFQAEASEVEVPRPIKRRHVRRYVLLAATIALVVSLLVVQTAGVNWFEALARWTSETFSIIFKRSDPIDDVIIYDDLIELRTVIERYVEKHVLLPTDLPDGYTQCEIKISENGEIFTAGYQNGDSVITIQVIRINSSTGSKIEQDFKNSVVYPAEAIDCYTMTNIDTYSAAWEANGYEYLLCGVQDKESLNSILDSIN